MKQSLDTRTKLLTKNPISLMIELSIPAVLGMVVVGLYNMMDSIFVGQMVGAAQMGAVSVSYPFTLINAGSAAMLGVGSASVLSRAIGKKDERTIKKIMGNLVAMVLLLSVIYTIEHITDFMYRILEVNKDDRVLDACCGSGGFLVKAMANMIQEASGLQTDKAKKIKSSQLFGIEFDREIYALACANMLIHKDGKTNLEQMDARTETSGKWIAKQKVTKVLMNPPYENKYGCMKIVENVLDNVPAHTMCGFILPDKKLEKASKAQMKRILKHHRLRKVIKLPEDVFFNVGVTTSIFIFETGTPQDKNEFFACWMESDGLATVKNKGRHDIYNKWSAIEDKWVDIVMKQSGDDSCQWVKPEEHLSYQMPQKPFEIFEEDFRKTAMDYLMFQNGVDTKKFGEKLLNTVMYSSSVSSDDVSVTVNMQKDGDNDGKN